MEQKTGSKNKVIIALAILTIVVVLIGVWAFARYTSTVSGSGTAAVASWSFKANGQTETMTADVDLLTGLDPVNGKVASNHMAPGTTGSFDIAIDATGSEVAVEYNVLLSGFTNLPKNLHFYTDSARQNEITNSSNTFSVSGHIPYSADEGAMAKTVTIYYAWPYQLTGDGVTEEQIAAQDLQDTQDAGKDVRCDITVRGWQSDPRTADFEN